MDIMKNATRRIASSLSKNKSMQKIVETIFSHSTLDENGKLWSPSGKCIGWYNRETGVGWCNLKDYKDMKNTQPNPNTEDDYAYDTVDLEEYFDSDDM